jgi:hypothetical protein
VPFCIYGERKKCGIENIWKEVYFILLKLDSTVLKEKFTKKKLEDFISVLFGSVKIWSLKQTKLYVDLYFGIITENFTKWGKLCPSGLGLIFIKSLCNKNFI